jgi:hypothetical protein
VVQKLSDLNYKIVDKKGREFVVHVNRLKKAYDQTPPSFENTSRPRQKPRKPDTETFEEDVGIHSRPIAISGECEPQVVETKALQEERLQLDQDSRTPGYVGTPDTDKSRRQPPDSSGLDPKYEPLSFPRSRRELATTPTAPPVTRNRASLQLEELSA